MFFKADPEYLQAGHKAVYSFGCKIRYRTLVPLKLLVGVQQSDRFSE